MGNDKEYSEMTRDEQRSYNERKAFVEVLRSVGANPARVVGSGPRIIPGATAAAAPAREEKGKTITVEIRTDPYGSHIWDFRFDRELHGHEQARERVFLGSPEEARTFAEQILATMSKLGS